MQRFGSELCVFPIATGDEYPSAAEVSKLGSTGPALGGNKGRGGVRAWMET